MKGQSTSLFKMTPKSLTDSQTKEVFSKFISISKELGIHKLPHVKFVTNKEKTRIAYKYENQSNMYDHGPVFSIDVISSCQGLEKIQLVRAVLQNCGLCHGSGDADITQRKFKQIDNVMYNAFALFRTTYEEHKVEDTKQLKFDKIITKVENACNKRIVKTKNKHGYIDTKNYLGKITGSVSEYRDNQSFTINIENLTPEQTIKIGEVISSL